MTQVRRPLMLMILDGWGTNPACDQNAACLASTPRLDSLGEAYPHTQLEASGGAVGLPEGQMGNSEVGHLNIGAGRIVYQELSRIDLAIEQGDFFRNPVLFEAMARIRQKGGKLHLMGLLSDGGVHSHMEHLYALLQMARQQGLDDVCVHAFLDGRDTPPQSGADYLAQLEEYLTRSGSARIATVVGRYFAMDRDHRWDRVEQAYRAMTEGIGRYFDSATAAIQQAYAEGQTDEFVAPCVIDGGGVPGTVDDGDGLIFFNFRGDRAREISRSFTEEGFSGFERRKKPRLSDFVCLTEYDQTLALPVAFPPASYSAILGEVLATAGLTQLRIAETEKYAHVTFFFNGGNEEPFPGEDRVLIPSPKEVATYDQKPAMSAFEVTEEVLKRVSGGQYDVIVLNYANPDMVGHTGNLAAAVEAMEAVDVCVGRVVDTVLAAGGSLIITADHGNCEQMRAADGSPHTAHTGNPVPLILVDPDRRQASLRSGKLADIAPTMLELLNLPQPPEMSGRSLLRD